MLKPIVSVVMVTFNHENYIREAIEGVLMQKCNFDIELIVANDCSTDTTDTIIEEILKKHPKASWIKYINHKENIGMMPNFIWALEQCKGKYIALCEGDDYWTDPLKLQIQVDFLEENTNFVIHSGAAKILKEGEETKNEEYIGLHDSEESFEIEDFLGKNNLITCTVLFRNCLTNFPKEFKSVTFGDWFLYIVLLHQTGLKAYNSVKVFSVYRVHDKSLMRSISSLNYYTQHINQVLEIKQYIGYKKFPPSVMQWINNYSVPKFRLELSNKMYRNALNTLIVNVFYCKFRISVRRYLSIFKHNSWVL